MPRTPVPFGRYMLLAPLGRGTMGELFLARLTGAEGFEKLCVIKRLLPQLAHDREFVTRFVNEARVLTRLNHGSIAQVFDLGVHEGVPFLALEFVDGKDLKRVAARAQEQGRPLPLSFVLQVMARVLDALAYAHRKRDDEEQELLLVHRDVSPPNILVSYEGEVKVIDFGLARSRMSASLTQPNVLLGKFQYMAPEQARHQRADRRSDLYAVGVCLYELIAGHNPFERVPPAELITRVAHPDVMPLALAAPGCPGPVASLVERALTVDPAGRFQSAEEFRAELQACLLREDPAAGSERLASQMHRLFAAEYQAERRLLAQFREAARAPLGVAPAPAREAPAPRPGPAAPPGLQPRPAAPRAATPPPPGEVRGGAAPQGVRALSREGRVVGATPPPPPASVPEPVLALGAPRPAAQEVRAEPGPARVAVARPKPPDLGSARVHAVEPVLAREVVDVRRGPARVAAVPRGADGRGGEQHAPLFASLREDTTGRFPRIPARRRVGVGLAVALLLGGGALGLLHRAASAPEQLPAALGFLRPVAARVGALLGGTPGAGQAER